jgi:protoheme IX farnesyltransferase
VAGDAARRRIGAAPTAAGGGSGLIMVNEPVLVAPHVSVVLDRPATSASIFADYWAITKPEVNVLVVTTTAAGFVLSSAAPSFPWSRLVQTLIGTVLVASGAAALNEWMEHPFDARMRRTARRAIAAGRLDPRRAEAFGAGLALCGLAYLAFSVGLLAASLAAVTLVSYLFVYTPLKRRTPWCTAIGAVPGAIPPLVGAAAARGRLDAGAWVLFAIVFLWQFPHVMAIAWMYRDDYDRAGYLVLPRPAARHRFVAWHTCAPLIALLPISLLPVLQNSSASYGIAAAALSGWFLYAGRQFVLRQSAAAARGLLFASIVYLPALLVLLMLLTP